MEEKLKKLFLNKTTKIIGSILLVYAFMRFLVPLFFPFLIAAYIAFLLHPMIRFLHRKLKIGKGFLAAGFLTIIGGFIGILVWLIITWGLNTFKVFLCNLDAYQDVAGCILLDCSNFLEERTGIDSGYFESEITKNANVFINNLQITYLPKLMDHSFYYLANLAQLFGVILITFISTVFLVRDYEMIVEKCKKNQHCTKIVTLLRTVAATLCNFIKAQFLIYLVVSSVCIGALFLCKSKYALIIGAVTGILDVFPFVGTAIVFIPWAIFDLLEGNIICAVIKLAACLLTILLRQILEPKLMGDKMGIAPIVMVMSVYLGAKIFGMMGIVMGPVALVLIIASMH